MPIHETYSERRRRREQAGKPEVYVYDEMPRRLREQVIHLWKEAFGSPNQSPADGIYYDIERTIAASHGLSTLAEYEFTFASKCESWLRMSDFDGAIDIVEYAAVFMESLGRRRDKPYIDDLNRRFQQNAFGYRFENGEMIRFDSQYTHAELIKPALSLLISDNVFKQANSDFMEAHRHYRAGENAQAVTFALVAFESTLKAICSKKSWPYKKGDRASDLIKLVNSAGLFPDYLDKGFESYIAAMKTGLPGVRNEAGPHGKAPDAKKVPDYVAAYAIHLSAANIVLAVEASRGNHKPRPAPKAPGAV